MVQECLDEDTTIPCHETIIEGPKAICRGFYDLHRKDVTPLRLAEAFNVVVFEDPPADGGFCGPLPDHRST